MKQQVNQYICVWTNFDIHDKIWSKDEVYVTLLYQIPDMKFQHVVTFPHKFTDKDHQNNTLNFNSLITLSYTTVTSSEAL